MRENRILLYDHEIRSPNYGTKYSREDVWKKQETHTWPVNNSNSYEHIIILTHPTVLAELSNHPTSFEALPHTRCVEKSLLSLDERWYDSHTEIDEEKSVRVWRTCFSSLLPSFNPNVVMKRLTCQCRRAVTQVAKPLENKPTKMLTWHHVNRPDREREGEKGGPGGAGD